MINKRHLFRGFHPDDYGREVIIVDGETIKGKWKFGYLSAEDYILQWEKNLFGYSCEKFLVIPETVGQYVTVDKNLDDIYDDDILLSADGQKWILEYDRFNFCYRLVNLDTYNTLDVDEDRLGKFELIGNKWKI